MSRSPLPSPHVFGSIVYSILIPFSFVFTALVLVTLRHLLRRPPRTLFAWQIRWAALDAGLRRALCGLTCRVRGRENIPNAPCVFASKHQSTWETIAFHGFFPPFVWVVKRELLWVPIMGWGLAAMNPIALDRSAGRQSLKRMLRQGRAALLDQGLSIMVFPEGTRSTYGTRIPYRTGAAALACSAGVPVVPVAHDAGRYWPRRGWLKSPGAIEVVIGPPIATRGRSPAAVTADIEAWIEGEMETLSNDP